MRGRERVHMRMAVGHILGHIVAVGHILVSGGEALELESFHLFPFAAAQSDTSDTAPFSCNPVVRSVYERCRQDSTHSIHSTQYRCTQYTRVGK